MDFDEVVVKESPGVCRCCLSEGCYKDMSTEYSWMNDTEVYADMLLECFDVSISQQQDGPNGMNRLICEVCITRLRDACNFKKQVLETEKKFVDMVAKGEFAPKVFLQQAEMKVEAPECSSKDVCEVEYLDDDFDMDFGDEDDLPLKPPTKKPKDEVDTPKITLKAKKGRPKKSTTSKPEKKARTSVIKIPKDKPRLEGGEPCSKRRRKNLQIVFNNTTIVPFKWRGKYLCFYCSDAFSEYHILRDHTLAHGPCSIEDHSLKALKGGHYMEVKLDVSDISCIICHENFGTFDDIVDHLNLKHNLHYDRDIDMPFEMYRLSDLSCTICKEKYSYFGYLVSHVNSSHPKNSLMCEKCNQRFNKLRDLFAHIKNYHKEGGYNCDLCNQNFSSLNILRKHRVNNHLSRCGVCHLKLPSASLKQKHMEIEHPDSDSLECDNCFKQFHTKQGRKMHLRHCKGFDDIYEAPKNEENTATTEVKKKISVKQLRQNIVTVITMSTAIPFKFYKNKYGCLFCAKEFIDPDGLREHTVMEHPLCSVNDKCMRKLRERTCAVNIDISSLACKVCFETLTDVDTLLDHLISKHNANYDRNISTCLLPYKLIKEHIPCLICGQEFRFFGTLLRHVNKSHGDNSIICVHCGQGFRKENNLRSHIWRHHRVGRFKCTICGADCQIPSRLYTHMAKEHGVKAEKCPKCPESFATPYLRAKHLIDVHDSGHKCSYCGKLFTRDYFMRQHIKRTHLKEKNVECTICNMKFFNNILLRRHMVKHSGEKNFHCDICGERFLWKKSLRTHMARHGKNLNSI